MELCAVCRVQERQEEGLQWYRHRTRARAKKMHKPTLMAEAEAEATRRMPAPKASKTPCPDKRYWRLFRSRGRERERAHKADPPGIREGAEQRRWSLVLRAPPFYFFDHNKGASELGLGLGLRMVEFSRSGFIERVHRGLRLKIRIRVGRGSNRSMNFSDMSR